MRRLLGVAVVAVLVATVSPSLGGAIASGAEVVPDTVLVRGPDPTIGWNDAVFDFRAEPAGSAGRYECVLRAEWGTTPPAEEQWQRCNAPFHVTGIQPVLPGQPPSATQWIRAVGHDGVPDPTPLMVQWQVQALPDARLTGGPSRPSMDPLPTLAWEAINSNGTLCTLDGVDVDCGLSFTPSAPLADGEHTFTVQAYELRPGGARFDQHPLRYTWVLDTTAPDTLITAAPPARTNATEVTIEYGSPAADEPYEWWCTVGGQPPAICQEQPLVLRDLPEGSHTVSIAAADLVGNLDPTPATATFVIDRTAPKVSVGGRPTGIVGEDRLVLLPRTDEEATLVCRISAPDAEPRTLDPCPTRLELEGLVDGVHSVAFTATDEAGNVGGMNAIFRVDTTPPDVVVTSQPPAVIASTTATIEYRVDSTMPLAYTECRLDGEGIPCASPLVLEGLTEGPHTVVITAANELLRTDPTPASVTFEVDLTAPDTTITSAPTGPTSDTTPTFAFSSTEPGRFECKVDGGEWSTCSSPHTTPVLAYGAHTFSVRAIDAMGHVEAVPATVTFKVEQVIYTYLRALLKLFGLAWF